jgi:hypothetical protein
MVRQVSLRHILWLGPVVFLIHDLEEVFWTRPWIEKNRYLFEGTQFEGVIEAMGYQPAKFGLVVALVTVLYGIISLFATRRLQAGLSMNLYVSALLILFVNVFTHAGLTVLWGMYTPGVVTAVLVVLPYTVIAFRVLKARRLLTRTTWKTSPFLSVGMLAVIFGLMIMIRW